MPAAKTFNNSSMQRLQKILAHAGLTSRREAEQWIVKGRVAVNGAVVRELGVRADPKKGRLDFNSSGLLLLTNDGELAQRLMHPRFGVNKVYHAKLSSCPTADDWAQLRKGIRLEDGVTAPARGRILQKLKKNAWIEIELHEGRRREVRRMFLALGYFVEKLVRVRVGTVSLGRLAPGELRPLTNVEVRELKQSVGLI